MSRSRTASVVYASIWVHSYHDRHTTSGFGSTKGCGYHKASAAVDAAIRSDGITLRESIGGAGETSIRNTIQAIAEFYGYPPGSVI